MKKKPAIKYLIMSAQVVLLLAMTQLAFCQVVKMEIEDLVNYSQLIISAEVVSSEAQWVDNDSGRNIVTFTKLKINQVIKGDLTEDELVLEIMGGQVGDIKQVVTPSVRLNINEQVVLFLERKPYQVVGAHQGKLEIVNDTVKVSGRQVSLDSLKKGIKTYLADPSVKLQFH